jgi:hypothetical protein
MLLATYGTIMSETSLIQTRSWTKLFSWQKVAAKNNNCRTSLLSPHAHPSRPRPLEKRLSRKHERLFSRRQAWLQPGTAQQRARAGLRLFRGGVCPTTLLRSVPGCPLQLEEDLSHSSEIEHQTDCCQPRSRRYRQEGLTQTG